MSVLLELFLTFGRISLIAIGGANAAIPEIRHAAVDVHQWMNTDTFTHLFAVAQSAPGPNVLIASIIGWHVAGIAGLVVATIAMVLPASVLAFAIGRVISHFTHRREYKLVQDAVVPVAIGLIIASGIELSFYSAFDVLTWSMVLGTLVFPKPIQCGRCWSAPLAGCWPIRLAYSESGAPGTFASCLARSQVPRPGHCTPIATKPRCTPIFV